ncbi:MAG: ABC transporter ATP-binding protein, partial [Flavobacterium sp.]|nr:ABC transporter ATP-binding protein [Flavobacterium sp.]
MEQPFLIFKNIKKTYDLNTPNEVSALNGVSFELERGEFVIIAGSNAAGKSTLFNIIAGSTMLDGGEIILEGKSITEMLEHKKAKFISRVWQNPSN